MNIEGQSEMAIVKITTRFPYDTFDLWSKEVHLKAKSTCGDKHLIYIAFVGDSSCLSIAWTDEEDDDVPPAPSLARDTYLYMPMVSSSIMPYDDDISSSTLKPVLCYPDVDMSTTSVSEFIGSTPAYGDCALEDLTLGDICASHNLSKRNRLNENVQDGFLRSLCMFVMLAKGKDTSKLRSYIRYIFCTNGLDSVYESLFPGDDDTEPAKHTIIELSSEMARVDRTMYLSYKYTSSVGMLRSITASSDSKSDIEYGLCGLVYHILCDIVVTCVGKLWCFVDGLWVEGSTDGYIWNFLTTQFIEYLYQEEADTVANHVKSYQTRTRMLRDIKLRLQNDTFTTLLDSRRELVRMKNGVYDTETSVLSIPVPSDYVSVVAGVSYELFDEKSARVSQLTRILGSIFPSPELLDFFMLSCSTFLEGHNVNKVFYIWWGTGNNAKSLVQTLIMKAFGDYCSTAPTSLITGKRTNSSNATPELCHVEKKLVVFLQEPNPDEKIKAGMIKEMTGNDRMYTRQLFNSGKTMVFKAKLVIVCNNYMEVTGMDAALRRRIVVLPFISTFLDPREFAARKAKGTLDFHSHIIEPSIESQLISCSSAFMYLICKKHSERRFSEHELNIPQSIIEITEAYVTKHNYPLMFIRTFVKAKPGCHIAIFEIYECFKQWFTRSYPGKRVVDSEVFSDEMAGEGYFEGNDAGIIRNVLVTYRYE